MISGDTNNVKRYFTSSHSKDLFSDFFALHNQLKSN